MSSPTRSPSTDLPGIFAGSSTLAALCRTTNWGATPLGPANQWPHSLSTAVNIVLAADFPMIVLWGPDLIQVYNDGYRSLMGDKHPAGLGQPNQLCWPEVWHINEPLFARVFAGETLSFREALYPLAPHGVIEETYLTLCYSPIRDEAGAVGGVLVTVFDVTSEVRARQERDQALAAADAERQRLTEVFQQAPSIIAVLRGPDHIFAMANPPYLQLVNHRDIVGKPVREALPEVVEQGFVALLDQVYTTGAPFVGTEMSIMLQPEPGAPLEQHIFNFVYQPLREADGTIVGILAHAVNVTDQVVARQAIERTAQHLTRTTQALERSNRELDHFAYITSHDLKAPLRGIANLATWIEEDLGAEATTEIREHLELLRGRVYRMESLIDGILAYSRVGRTTGRPERVAIADLLDEVIDLHAPPSTVTITVDPAMPVLETQRLPLYQVFANLISNAIKHHPGPEAAIAITAAERDGWVEFAVRDNGAGIDPQYHERIFGIFQTLASRDQVEGSGLGLALVKKIVESQGGTIRVESAEGQGSTFSFTWPRGPVTEGAIDE
ncbi:MAG TPA: ATP-binding protein [Herpetosiphonaceae bacterium]|nr:ATP-binding protein [Herpetosiphonaceae bacterium]